MDMHVIELCFIWCKKRVQEKLSQETLSGIQVDLHKFPVQIF